MRGKSKQFLRVHTETFFFLFESRSQPLDIPHNHLCALHTFYTTENILVIYFEVSLLGVTLTHWTLSNPPKSFFLGIFTGYSYNLLGRYDETPLTPQLSVSFDIKSDFFSFRHHHHSWIGHQPLLKSMTSKPKYAFILI